MRIITTNLPKYTVIFEHPDTGSEFHTFFVEDGREPSPFAEDAEWETWYKELMIEVWNKYNHYGYYHSMTILAEWVINGEVHIDSICKEVGKSDL